MGTIKPAPFTAERLRELTTYDPETGHLHWRVRRRGGRGFGNTLGTKLRGRWYVHIDGYLRPRSRIIWYWVTGTWPALDVDHENRDPADDRWGNLRLATESENQCNRGTPSNNTSGHKGVYWLKRHNRWAAAIKAPGMKRIYLGAGYKTKEEAIAAYREAAIRLHGEFACLA